MAAIGLHDKSKIESALRRHPFLQIYALGDLDDFFWPYTTWYALPASPQLEQIALFYWGVSLPVLHALSEEPAQMAELLRAIAHLLPKRFYAHLSGDLATVFAETYDVESHGTFYKMALTGGARLDTIDTSVVIPLSTADVDELETLYRASYPGKWFDPRMLETGHYYGLRQGDVLVATAGIHVYSARYKVAALGNITTHPDFRGQGLAAAVTAKLCQALLQSVATIGLNVSVDNAGAIDAHV